MNLVQITPGAGGMYCGNCFRDNALVAEWRRQGHETLMLPLYLPMTLDEPDQSASSPIFFGGINVYLQQQSSLFRYTPDWLRHWLSSPRLLKWATGRAAKTRASELGELTLSMLRGEEGRQARELDELIAWLRGQPRPDAVFLSNALLLGMARRLGRELGCPIVCMLQGEDEFVDSLNAPFRDACWQEMSVRAREVDRFIAPSAYFGERMAQRLALTSTQLRVVPNGIQLEGYASQSHPAPTRSEPPVLGFFARMCPEKGLDRLIEAFLMARSAVPQLRLKVGGGCGPGDEPFVEKLKTRLREAGALDAVEFHPNVDRAGKIRFLQSLSFFSVPAGYSEAFGLYLVEAMAAGVPVIQPDRCAFREIVERSGGGLVVEDSTRALSDAFVRLVLNPEELRRLSVCAAEGARRAFSVEAMAKGILQAMAS